MILIISGENYDCPVTSKNSGDFPGGSVVSTPCTRSRGPGLDPGSGNKITHAAIKSVHADK